MEHSNAFNARRLEKALTYWASLEGNEYLRGLPIASLYEKFTAQFLSAYLNRREK